MVLMLVGWIDLSCLQPLENNAKTSGREYSPCGAQAAMRFTNRKGFSTNTEFSTKFAPRRKRQQKVSFSSAGVPAKRHTHEIETKDF